MKTGLFVAVTTVGLPGGIGFTTLFLRTLRQG
jgi:hypothetical protein